MRLPFFFFFESYVLRETSKLSTKTHGWGNLTILLRGVCVIELKLGGWCRIALGTGVGVVGVRVTERPGVAVLMPLSFCPEPERCSGRYYNFSII